MCGRQDRGTGTGFRLILASASPRRRELLALTGWRFESRHVSVDESPRPNEPAEALVARLAREKASSVGDGQSGARFILGADTIVVDDGALLGKPHSAEEAQRMLLHLRGRTHRVLSALALVDRDGGGDIVDVCETEVPMRNYGRAEVMSYVASGGAMDKAGAYGIQDGDFDPVDVSRLHGCYANVMGMPLCHILRAVRHLGEDSVVDVPRACQAHTGYCCSVYPGILKDQA